MKTFCGYKNLNIVFILTLCFLASGYLTTAFGASFNSVICGAVSDVTSWPRNYKKMTCTVDITGYGVDTLRVGVAANSTTTTRNSGNGTDLTITVPETRFKADGPAQGGPGGTPADIDTVITYAGTRMVKTGINANGSFNVDIRYTTYEADYGDTNYTQNFTFRLYNETSQVVEDSSAQSITFTITNKQYLSKSADPSITLNGSSEVYSFGTFFSSNTFTINVKANNTWKLQAKLLTVPTDATKTIPITSNYSCVTSSAFYKELGTTNCSNPDQFAVVDTYYDVAENNNGEKRTGTSDGINLDSIGVAVTFRLKNLNDWSDAYDKGNYSCTSRFNLISPF